MRQAFRHCLLCILTARRHDLSPALSPVTGYMSDLKRAALEIAVKVLGRALPMNFEDWATELKNKAARCLQGHLSTSSCLSVGLWVNTM